MLNYYVISLINIYIMLSTQKMKYFLLQQSINSYFYLNQKLLRIELRSLQIL